MRRIERRFERLNDELARREIIGKALEVVARCYPRERLPQKTLYALEEMLQPPGRG